MKISYQTYGEGSPIILIHAFPLSGKMWLNQIEPLINAGFRVITPDLRGFGETHNFSDINLMEDLANDIAELLEKLNIEKAAFCGLSMGGYVIFNLFRLFPEKISALILCDTNFAADSEEKKQNRFELIEKIEDNGSKALITNMLPNLVGEFTKKFNQKLINELEIQFSKTNPQAAIAALRAMAERLDYKDFLSKINVPTALIFGEDDKVTNLDTARFMHDEISNSKLFIIKKAGHYSNLEQPEQFNQALLNFLQNL